MDDVKFDNKSRMGLTLQDYDQVIALSQININQTLKRHFKIDEMELANFRAELGSDPADPNNSLQGKIDAPTIQLVDADKADQAIYTLRFLKGAEYMYWHRNPKDRRAGQVQKKLSAEGWTVAFFVSFAMETAGRLPPEVKEVVMKAGSYSVEQLVIVFGSAELITLAPSHCNFVGLETDLEALLELKNNIGLFINQWLTQLRNAGAHQSHNILGYTVKVDVKDDPSQDQLKKRIGNLESLSSPPTSVQFQTIANKADEKSAGDPADPYNAFLFTEMTKGRALPKQDLQWSGNWFYGTTGGTMNMSSSIFLREFVGTLVEPLHKTCTSFAKPLAQRQTWDAEVRIARVRQGFEFLSEWIHGKWLPTGTNQWQLDSTAQKSHYDIPWVDMDKIFSVQVIVEAKMTSWLIPYPGTGKFDIQQRIMIVTKWMNHSIQYTFDATSIFHWKYTVTLATISSGALTSSVVYSIDKANLAATIMEKGVPVRGISSKQTEQEAVKWKGYEELLKSTIENRMTNSTDFTDKIDEGLNGQTKFIFPGGGTFDMSDPVFSQVGDLLLGLVYRSGKL